MEGWCFSVVSLQRHKRQKRKETEFRDQAANTRYRRAHVTTHTAAKTQAICQSMGHMPMHRPFGTDGTLQRVHSCVPFPKQVQQPLGWPLGWPTQYLKRICFSDFPKKLRNFHHPPIGCDVRLFESQLSYFKHCHVGL